MADGVVTRLKKGMTEKVKVKTWVFAAVNREENLPPELKSRFLIRRLKEYSEQDYKEVVRAVLAKREHVAEAVAREIADRMASFSRDVRDAVKVARLYKGQQSMAVEQVIELAFER
jgi:MoxR-like ATPase